MTRNRATMGHLVVLLIEVVNEDHIVVSDCGCIAYSDASIPAIIFLTDKSSLSEEGVILDKIEVHLILEFIFKVKKWAKFVGCRFFKMETKREKLFLNNN